MLAIDAIPNAYKAYAILLNGELIAATIVVTVTDKVAYNFLPASNKKYNYLSPMAMLMICLYDHLRQSGFSNLDWGVTSIDGQIQQGLAVFKEAMGAKKSFRSTYVLN